MVVAFKRFDAAHYLKSDEDVALYLEAVNEFDDPAQMVVARETVVRAIGLRLMAVQTGP
jgi:DNA-binding phage protein